MARVREFTLPDLGEGLEDGEVVEWLVAVGDHVALNQTVATVESAKALVELPSPFEGRVTDICATAGDTVPVGAVLMRITVEDGAVGDAPDSVADPGVAAAATEATAAVVAAAAAGEPEADPKPLVGYGAVGPGASMRRRRATAVAAGHASPAAPAPVQPVPEPAAAPTAASPAPAPAAVRAAVTASERARALPPVRRLAKNHRIDLQTLAPGSGPDGRIVRRDVEAALARTSSATPALPEPAAPLTVNPSLVGFRGRYPGEVEQVKGIRKRIIAKMEESRRTIPDAGCARDTDMTALWELRSVLTEQAAAEGRDIRITPLAMISRATVLALRRFPTLNSRYDPEAGEIRLLEQINLGMAVDTESGLMVANIKNAEQLSVLELAEETARLATRCRNREATPEDLTGGTFTVNNYGYFGNDDGSPIINAPESGILGIGAIRERPWVVDGQLAVRRVARLQLVFDHRVCDGGEAGRFIDSLARLCEDPRRLLLHG